MKKLFSTGLVLFLTLTSLSCAMVRKGGDFKIQKYETQLLPNGLSLLWIEDSTLPYVSFQMMVNSGSSQDPVGKEGLASFVGGMLVRGTTKRNAVRIAEDLEQLGSSFNASVEPDYTLLSMTALSFHAESALAQFSELVLEPSFEQKEMERYRQLILASLQKLPDNPNRYVEYVLPQFLYGKHPYGHESVGAPRSVKKLQRADLMKFYKDHYAPGNATLAVVGKLDSKIKQAIVQTFSQWQKTTGKKMEVPNFPSWKGIEILLVDKGDLNQAQIQIAFKGVPRNIPDYMELRAALKILGESFGSRLMEEIRVRRGLTYHIRAWFDPRLKPGPMGIYTSTRLDKVDETVEQTLKTYRRLIKDGVTDKEVEILRGLMKGQFPRIVETPESLAYQLLILRRYGVDPVYLRDHLKLIDNMTRESINHAIRKYFDPENLRILVYAPRKNTEAVLKKFGKLEVKGYQELLLQ